MTACFLHPLSEVDPALVEDLLDLAFEPAPEPERRTAYKVREGTECLAAPRFAALDEGGHLCGTIQCWPVALTVPVKDGRSRRHPLIMVGPVAVLRRMRNGKLTAPYDDEPISAGAAG